MIIAHRGNYEHSPFVENSIEALTTALKKDYIQGVELDVRMTKDHVLVIHHNATIDHTSDGKGILSTMTLHELYQYNFGTTKHPSKIATLQNFLDVIDTDKDILIELKDGGENNQIYIKKVGDLLRKYPHIHIKICSFSDALLRHLRKQYPEFQLGKITFLKEQVLPSYVQFLSIYHKTIESDMKYQYYVWTITKKKELASIKKRCNHNCQGLITDIPKTVASYFKNHSDNHHKQE